MKYLGVDFGLRRVGIAISEGSLATPFKTVQVKSLRDAAYKVSELAKREKVEKIIVGLPEGKMGSTVLGFIATLKRMGFDVEGWDETLSSKVALDKMIEASVPRRRRKVSDDIAAAIILQDYIESSKS